MKFTIHVTKKNVWVWLVGVSAVMLTAIGIIIPSPQWGVPPWKWIIFSLLFSALIGATMMLLVQSREDHEKEERESRRDAVQETLKTQVAQLAAKGEERSLAVAQATESTLSSLSPGVDFKFADYFRLAHMSQLTEQTTTDIKILVAQQYPEKDREDVLAKFIGIGFWGYAHETTWPYIFKSQILALTELNARGGILPLAEVKAHYDRAAAEYPGVYANYMFNSWMNFMLTHSLFISKPGDAVEITLRGRDFLTYIAHWGWNLDARKF